LDIAETPDSIRPPIVWGISTPVSPEMKSAATGASCSAIIGIRLAI